MKLLRSLLQRGADESPPESGLLAPAELDDVRTRWHTGGRLEELLDSLAAARGKPGAPLQAVDLRGVVLVEADLSGLDLSGADLRGADLSRANLEGTTLFRAQMAGTTLFHAQLARAELAGADLERANLQGAQAQGAGLGMARLTKASLFEADLTDASLTDADLSDADLRMSTLTSVRARGVDLRGADLTRADLTGAELDDCRVDGAVLDRSSLRRARLEGVRGYEDASWLGADIRGVDFTGAWRCRRFIQDQNYLDEFRRQSLWTQCLYQLWWATSDCGRSLTRWTFFTALLALAFAGLYMFVGVDYGMYETPLSPIYYSVVTLTTLGYGDVLPRTIAAQIVAMAEVIVGYVMLGGLLSILSGKMARRSD